MCKEYTLKLQSLNILAGTVDKCLFLIGICDREKNNLILNISYTVKKG